MPIERFEIGPPLLIDPRQDDALREFVRQMELYRNRVHEKLNEIVEEVNRLGEENAG